MAGLKRKGAETEIHTCTVHTCSSMLPSAVAPPVLAFVAVILYHANYETT